jgi:hypothetical protein
MFKQIRNWFRKQREEYQAKAFDEGYAWAKEQYEVNKIDVEDIYMMMDGIESPFDDGAYEALRMIQAGEKL